MATRVVNLKREPYDVYIGRPSKWGNPFKIGDLHHGLTLNRGMAIEAYRDWLFHSQEGIALQNDIHELIGKVLGCYCKPEPCHGDVLLELAEHEEAALVPRWTCCGAEIREEHGDYCPTCS